MRAVLLGYEPLTKAYRLYNPTTRKVIISRDVVFDETKQWDWSKESDLEMQRGNEFTVIYPPQDVIGTGEAPMRTEHITQPSSSMSKEGELGSNDEPATPVTPLIPTVLFPDIVGSDGVNTASTAESSSAGPQGYRNLQDLMDESFPCTLDLDDDNQCMLGAEEPASLAEAQKEACWKRAMDEEINSIIENQTWEMVDPPSGQKPIGLRWVYKVKKDPSGAVVKHKARLVAKGFVQKKGIDFEEAFAPVARMETVRLLVALAAQEGWEVHHMDVKSAFLNGELQEDVYVCQAPGYEEEGKEYKVLKLQKALYGLRQAPRAWNIKLDASLMSLGFARCLLEHGVYSRSTGNGRLLVGVYVDDLIILGSSTTEIAKFKNQMKEKFKMSDLGLLSYYLGIEVVQNANGISLCQAGYAMKILDKAGMSECNPCQVPMEPRLKLYKSQEEKRVDPTRYRSLVGSLRYLINTRPDLAYSMGIVSRFMEEPTVSHMAAVKQILRYVKGSITLGCHYGRKGEGTPELVGFCDSDLAGDVNDRKSTSGAVFFLGSNLITWASLKQKTVAFSSCEAKYMSAATAACQGIWLSRLLAELQNKEAQCVKLKIDNMSAISLSKNPVYHDRSKHIQIRYHFIRNCVEEGSVAVEHVSTGNQLADLLTKPLARVKFLGAS